MGRRSTLVAFAAVAAMAFVPVNASAAVAPTGLTATPAGSAPPVVLSWNTAALDATTSQEVWRAAGACSATPIAGATQIGNPAPPALGGTSTLTDTAPPDGTWCYYVEADDIAPSSAYTAGVAVTVDQPSTGTVAVSGQTNGTFIHGAVDVTGTAADAGSGVASSVLLASTADCQTTAVVVGVGWTPTDGTYNVCNVVTDGAGHVTVVQTIQVIADSTPPTGTIAAPLDGTTVTGIVPLQITDADANGITSVAWTWTGAAAHAIGTGAGNRNWNTQAGNAANRPPDGPITISAVVTDMAGNTLTTAPVAVVVDNVPPDGAAVLSAPPAVAGSPTITWTPAHDDIGIASYDVLRNGVVIGTVAGDQGLAFNDKNAPDQQTSQYKVVAYDGVHTAAHSIVSNAVNVLVDSTAQSAPRALTAATPTAAVPTLTWQAPPAFAVDHYDIYRDGLLLASTTTPATSYTDGTATEGVHDYAVLARGANALAGVLSASFKVTYDLTPPTSGGAPTAQVAANGSVALSWPAAADALSGVSGYVVRRAAGATPPATADAATAVCTATATTCVDATASSGTWSYGVFARDGASNTALIGTVAKVVIVDNTAPLAPTKLKFTRTKSKAPATHITVTLHWVKPIASDLSRVVVVLNLQHPPKVPSDGKAVYHGLGSSAKIKLKAGDNGYFAIYSYDTSENFSAKPARLVVKLAALIPLRPLNGSTIHTGSPLLTWKPFKGTTYYNVQLFVNGKRILVGWPSTAAYRIPKGKLMPGTYVWYVWPAIGGKGGAAKFGKLIGRATFKYKI
jgi:hypothetical protein